jgi:hypothetical protein
MKKSEFEKQKRELRLQMGRLRRRINSRMYAAGREGRRLVSWREYVTRYPGYAMLAALGAGLAVSGGLGRSGLVRRAGIRLARQGVRHAGQYLWREIQGIWSQRGNGR